MYHVSSVMVLGSETRRVTSARHGTARPHPKRGRGIWNSCTHPSFVDLGIEELEREHKHIAEQNSALLGSYGIVFNLPNPLKSKSCIALAHLLRREGLNKIKLLEISLCSRTIFMLNT